ncbi:MAG TPA: 1,6-anhydro-N-acetylmuramyl-L-alanine amidase AmpD [Burkholderiales bacterium]
MRVVRSPNQDRRPPGTEVTLAVIHCISLPPGEYGGDAIERLFTNRLDPGAHPYFREIHAMRVSAHFLIRREGELVQFVPVARRAWHAGVSCWRGRSRCNDFSVGIELEGTEDSPFEDAQYDALVELLGKLRLSEVAAHSDIAPGRKRDPGARFDWPRLLAALARY